MPFNNAVMGGKYLVREVMESENFSLADEVGWAIFENGDAYFFNVTATGAVTSNTVIISGSGDGLFIYDGTPMKGSLLLSIASSGGADPYGNEYSGPGISITGPGGSSEIQIRPDQNGIFVYS